MEASTLHAPVGLTRTRISVGAPLLRLRSDEQLVALFRAGHDEAFRVIHDRYRQRLFAYTRQMIPGSRQDAEDALQEVFVRAYSGLRANDRELALRAWLYRVAHNRCIDELRRPVPPAPEVMELVRSPIQDPITQAEQRESLRRLIADVRRLPEQQRSALLMRELSGMSYAELAGALGVSTAAVKSLLVRARVGLARAQEARDTACSEIHDELLLAHDRRVRPNAVARRHLRDCPGCRQFRGHVRGVSRQLGALVPALGPAAALAKLLGIGGGASGGAAAGSASAGGAACAGGAVGGGGIVCAGGVLATGAGHVATILAAAVVTAGGAIEIQHTIAMPTRHHARSHRVPLAAPPSSSVGTTQDSRGGPPTLGTTEAPAPAAASANSGATGAPSAAHTARAGLSRPGSASGSGSSAGSTATASSTTGASDAGAGPSGNAATSSTSSSGGGSFAGAPAAGAGVPAASSSATVAPGPPPGTSAPATGSTPSLAPATSGPVSGDGSRTSSPSGTNPSIPLGSVPGPGSGSSAGPPTSSS